MSIDDLKELFDKLVEAGLDYKAEEASTREVVIKKTEKFVAPPMAELWARSVAAGVLGRLSQPERVQYKRQFRIQQRGSLSPWQRQAERRLAALLAR